MVVGYDPVSDSIISSFRGTHDPVNYILDAAIAYTWFLLKGCLRCLVHNGFLLTYVSLVK